MKKEKFLKSIENKSAREVKTMFVGPAKEIKIKTQVFQDKVHLKLELTHKQYEKLKKLKALKSHRGGLEDLFENLIEQELKSYETNKKFQTSKSLNLRYISKKQRNYFI